MDKNEKLANTAKLAEKSASALALVQNQIAVLEKENAFLRAQIIQFGIDAAASSSGATSHLQQQQHQQQHQSASMLNRPFPSSPLAQSLLNTIAQSSQPSGTSMAMPPATPPLPLASVGLDPSNPAAAQQLLISLAQTLTNSPLLAPLSQNQVAAAGPPPPSLPPPAPAAITNLISSNSSNLTLHPVTTATPSSAAMPSSASLLPLVSTSPARASLSSQVSSLTPVTPQQLQTSSMMAPPPPNAGVLQASPAQVTPLITSLVQTLSSFANTNVIPSPAPVLPKVSPNKLQGFPQATPPLAGGGGGGGGGLSAAAAASLLNTLIMAQNVLTNGGGVAQGGGVSMGDLSSVLTGNVNLDRMDQ